MGRAACFDGGGHAKVASHVWHASIECKFLRGLLMFVFFINLLKS